MGWTNPNVQQVTPLAQVGGINGVGAVVIPAAGSTVILNQVDVSLFESYDLNMYAYANTPGQSGSPFSCQVQLQWYDDLTTGIPVFEEDWWPWIGRAAIGSIGSGSSSMNPLAGAGPMHGRYLTVTVAQVTLATSSITLQWFNFFGSGRSVPDSDWRQQMTAVVPQVFNLVIQAPTNEPAFGFDNVLANLSNRNIGNSTVAFIPFNLYAGPTWVRFQASGAASSNPVICVFGGLVGGGPIAGLTCPNILAEFTADGLEHEITTQLPRAACGLIVSSPSTGLTISLEVVGQQAA